jgi:hypothetical protein
MPAKAGVKCFFFCWIPAYAGMSGWGYYPNCSFIQSALCERQR